MMETKVVDFPGSKPARRKLTGDAKLVDDVRKAWRALVRAIEKAERSGLDVECGITHRHVEPKITREFR